MPSGYFQTTYEGARQGLGTIGQALQQTAQAYAGRKEKKREEEFELKKLEQQAKLKQEYPDPLTALLAAKFGIPGEGTPLSGAEKSPNLLIPRSKEEALASIPQGDKPEDYEVKPVYGKVKGMPYIVGYETKITGAASQAKAKRQKNVEDIKFNVDSVTNLMVPMVKAFKSMRDTTKEQTGLGAGRVAGAYNTIAGMAGLNPDIKSFEGQKLEVAAALARIAMPGIRSERAIRTFMKTLPNEWSTDEEAEKQIRNSVNNAMARGYASRGLPFGTKAQEEAKTMVDSILAQSGYGTTEQKIQQFNIGGKVYNIPSDKVGEFKKDMGL